MHARNSELKTTGGELYRDMKIVAKKFVTTKEGKELYSMGYQMFRDLAEAAGAVYRVGGKVLINTELFEKYLETFRVERY